MSGASIGGRVRASSLRAAAITVLGIGVCLAGLPAAAAAAPLPPDQDPFYTYSGDLGAVAPGTVLNEREVMVDALGGTQTPLPAFQLLFRTTDQLGQPALAVTTVIRPLSSATPPRILSWQTFYDTLGAQCDPSYTLQGGGSSFDNCDEVAQGEGSLASTFLSQGATVVITDYEETTEAFAVGALEGYATLDGIRAAESYLGYSRAATPVAMIGYSGGAIASQWAAEVAPAYAPKLHIVATAAGGVFADPADSFAYINGNGTGWAYVLPLLLFMVQRGFHADISQYLSPLGARVVADDQHADIASFDGDFYYLQQLLTPQYADFAHVPAFADAMAASKMGSNGTPKSPIFLGNGEGIRSNGYDGDGVMVTSAVTSLARQYCKHRVPVEYQEYPGLDHTEAAGPFFAFALPYLSGRLAGLPAVSNCSAIETGSAPNVYPNGNTCSSGSASGSCTAVWSADVTGEYFGVTSGSWELQQLDCTPDRTSCSWSKIAGGDAGLFAAPPGALTPGHTYQLVIDGEGGGAVGSITGTGAI